ncbi:MAG: hypothetical protein NXH95_01330 [Pseudomonadaceae bacterium]|nr:hypothetical protein [Pseudomonadaceae bacterium]
MNVLVLGGTEFLGRHLVELLLDTGHKVTLFNRGKTNPTLFDGDVEKVIGDRDGDLNLLRGRHFDACVDPSGYVPRLVGDSARALQGVIEHYTFISSISVYPEFVAGQDETAALSKLKDPTTEDVTDATYGGLKVLCEKAAEDKLPGKVLNVRAGLITGPYDPTDRFTFWPVRSAAGGEFVAPVSAALPVQFIDARDIALWVIACMENRVTGTFNVTGEPTTLGAVLTDCREVAHSNAEPVWMPEDYLLQQDIRPWVDLPLWLPEPARGMLQVDTLAARQHGLKTRAARASIEDILKTSPRTWDELKVGLKRQREAELLKDFRTRK